jgi:hypothetical protein
VRRRKAERQKAKGLDRERAVALGSRLARYSKRSEGMAPKRVVTSSGEMAFGSALPPDIAATNAQRKAAQKSAAREMRRQLAAQAQEDADAAAQAEVDAEELRRRAAQEEAMERAAAAAAELALREERAEAARRGHEEAEAARMRASDELRRARAHAGVDSEAAHEGSGGGGNGVSRRSSPSRLRLSTAASPPPAVVEVPYEYSAPQIVCEDVGRVASRDLAPHETPHQQAVHAILLDFYESNHPDSDYTQVRNLAVTEPCTTLHSPGLLRIEAVCGWAQPAKVWSIIRAYQRKADHCAKSWYQLLWAGYGASIFVLVFPLFCVPDRLHISF